MSTFKISLRKAREAVKIILSSGQIPFLLGSPAIGKSAIVAGVAKEANLKMIDVRASGLLPEDVNGMGAVVDGQAKFLPFTDKFPPESMEVPKGFSGWLLFLDELTNASREVQAALYQLLLDRMVGDYRLHPNVFIVVAGNRVSDRAAANAVGTALQSRVVTLDVEPFLDEWLDDVAIPGNYDHRLISFLMSNTSQFLTFNPTAREELTFSAPRTLSMLNDLLVEGELDVSSDVALPIIAGCVGSDTAAKFRVHCTTTMQLPAVKDIIANPQLTEMPTTASLVYGVIVSILSYIKDDTDVGDIERLVAYALRVPSPSYLVVFGRNLIKKRPDVEMLPVFPQLQMALSRALQGN